MHSGISALEWIKSPAAIYCDPKDKLASIEDLANALLFCINMNSEEWSKASEAAIAFARENSTEEKAREIIDYYLGIA
jgi:glycosyltransferase involved in cell wall biosynthesis